MHKALMSELIPIETRKLRDSVHMCVSRFAQLRDSHRRAGVAPSANAPARRNTRIRQNVGISQGRGALATLLVYRAQRRIGGCGPAESTSAALPVEWARAPRVRHALRDAATSLALGLLVLVAVLTAPFQRSSASDSPRPSERLRCELVQASPDTSSLSATEWILCEDEEFARRFEDDEDDDESCSPMRQAYDTVDPLLSPSRNAPPRNIEVRGRLSVLQPLRC